MARTRKTPRKERKRAVRVQLIARPPKKPKKPDMDSPYTYVDALVNDHHQDLSLAKIAVAWALDVKPDKEGHVLLGKMKKATDLDREFRDFDLVVLLNSLAWKAFDEKQRKMVVDHFLCGATRAVDQKGEDVFDERDRLCYRLKKCDIQEYYEIEARYKMRVSDFQEVARDANGPHAGEKPLFGYGENGEPATE